MKRSVSVLMAAVLLAGCFGGDPDATEPETPDPGTGDNGDGPGDVTVGDPVGALPSTLYFTRDGLTPDHPNATEAERVALDWDAWSDFFVTNAMPTRFKSSPAESSYLITEMSATVHITTDGVATNAPQIIPEVPAWIGTTEGMVSSFFGSAPVTLLPGDVAQVDLEWTLPMGGLVVPAGESLVVDLATAYLRDPVASEVFLLVGAEPTLSQVRLQAVPVHLPEPDSTETILSDSGSLQGAECVAGETDGSRMEFEAEVPDGTVEMRVEMTRTGGTPAGDDIDVRVVDAAGERVAGTSDPSGTETLVLYAPNFAEAAFGSWTFVVMACAPQQVDFTLQVTLGLRAAPDVVAVEAVDDAQ